MNVISTWTFRPWLDGHRGPWPNTESMLAVMKASMNCALRAYETVTIYTDELSLGILEKLAPGVNFKIELNHAFNYVPTSYWAWPKLITYSLQNRPFLHFDLDFLFARQLPASLFDCNVLIQWWEKPGNFGFYNLAEVYNQYRIPRQLETNQLDRIFSPNLGCFYINDLEFNRVYVDTVFELVDTNKDLLVSNPIAMCSLEQQVLGILLYKNTDIKVQTLLPKQTLIPITNDFIHFVGEIKDRTSLPEIQELHERVLDTWITDSVIQIAQELDSQKTW